MMGAVLAGGQSSRFGSDKALAELGGVPLLEHTIRALGQWCDTVVVVGRETAPVRTLPDWPRPGLGPLGGIAAALRFAEANGHSEVLTCGVDSLDMPEDLPNVLSPAPAYLMEQPVIGLWPSSAFGRISDMLAGTGRHSMLAFAASIGARPVHSASEPANINTPADLAAAEQRHGL